MTTGIIKITVDTNMIDTEPLTRLNEVAEAHDLLIDVRTVTVNNRERGSAASLCAIAETLVWDESRWDEAVWGEDLPIREVVVLGETPLGDGVVAPDNNRLEAILRVISNGAFPPAGERDALTEPQARQLRDAISLEAHAREGRDVFISGDKKAFVNHGRRERLEQLCSTRIVAEQEIGVSWP